MTGLERFKRDIRKTAKEHGIKILLSKKEMIFSPGSSLETKGYFDDTNKELCVSIYGSERDWLHILVHESCHMDQYIEDQFLWQKCTPAVEIFDSWLGDKAIVKREVLEEAVQDIIRLELDCERRSLEKIKKYDLDINLDDYQKISNISLYLYLFSLEKKKWLPDLTSKKSVYKVSPIKLKKIYIKIPRRLHRILEKEYKSICS